MPKQKGRAHQAKTRSFNVLRKTQKRKGTQWNACIGRQKPSPFIYLSNTGMARTIEICPKAHVSSEQIQGTIS